MLKANATKSYNFVLIRQGTFRYKLLIYTVFIELMHSISLIQIIAYNNNELMQYVQFYEYFTCMNMFCA